MEPFWKLYRSHSSLLLVAVCASLESLVLSINLTGVKAIKHDELLLVSTVNRHDLPILLPGTPGSIS